MVRLDVGRRNEEKARPCMVDGCKETSERSVPGEKAVEYVEGLRFGDSTGRKLPRAHLCRTHYKQFKKASKADRITDSLGYEA